jgi:glycosyltransferase involved in cell wall biosynthesis
MTRVAAFTGGINVPSARYRVRQFVEPLLAHRVQVHEHTSQFGSYPPANVLRRPGWLLRSVASRVPGVIASWTADVTWLQREFVSTLQTLEFATGRPRVLDVDDALWLLPRGSFARRLAQRCDRLVVGNNYLAEYFAPYCTDLRVVPTAVNTSQLIPPAKRSDEFVTVGWSGSSGGFRYLHMIEQALADVRAARAQIRILIMADRRPEFSRLSDQHFEFVQWSPQVEVPTLQRIDIGLMPLVDGPWERGKCSFKMLQYLACGAPVVVSPVGMNAEILGLASVGAAATTDQDWVDGILGLVDAADERRVMGSRGRALIETHYSTQVLVPTIATALSKW